MAMVYFIANSIEFALAFYFIFYHKLACWNVPEMQLPEII